MPYQTTDYLDQKILKHTFGIAAYTAPSAVYVGLFTSDPTKAGAGTELTAGGYSYARKLLTPVWDGTGKQVNQSTLLRWDNLPAAVITHAAVFDALSAGNMLWQGPLAASKTVAAGDSLEIPAATGLVAGYI